LLDKAALLKLVEPVLPTEASEVKPEELAQLLAARRAVPVDVRDQSSYSRYHIPGAVHVPSADAVGRRGELAPTDGRVRVLYGRTTDEAKDLAAKLREHGVDVGFLAGGFLHWEADGFEVERGG
jgi:rhodanese-related sulfurtransferase